MQIDWYRWVLPILPLLGVILFGIVIWQTRKAMPRVEPREANPEAEAITNSSWLEQVLTGDRISPAGRIYRQGSMWSFKGFNSTDSFIEVIVPLINAAIFPILIEGISGSFVIKGDPCAQDAQMEGRTRIPHGQYGNIRIKQYLTPPMVKSIRSTRPEKALEISLKSCKLNIHPEIPGEQATSEHIIIFEGNYNLPLSEVLGTNDWFAVNTS